MIDQKETFYSFSEVQERLVEAMLLWWRIEGGRWPFAGDGPWNLIRRDDSEAGKAEAILNAAAEGRAAAAPPRRLPLSLEEIARRDEATEWLRIVEEKDRQLVLIVIAELARGAKRVSWTKVRAKMRVENGTRALGMRYSRAVTRIAQALSKGRGAALDRGMAEKARISGRVGCQGACSTAAKI